MLALFLTWSTSIVKIMPLGDSITGGTQGKSCWRAKLWQKLHADGFNDIDFVGSNKENSNCGVDYDSDSEGHSQIGITNIAKNNQLPAWLTAAQPDIILMHLGTNDIGFGLAQNHITMQDIEDAYNKLLTQMRAYKPNIVLLVAQIIPLTRGAACPNCARDVVTMNTWIGQWGPSKSTATSPITVVDQWTGFDVVADTMDGIHPNNAGHEKMANKWLPPLEAAIKKLR
jgi:lysophospholipase L1-like esterase